MSSILFSNQLTGTIPDSIGNLINLDFLYVIIISIIHINNSNSHLFSPLSS